MQLDFLSFVLGLAAGLLIWFLYSRLRTIIPVIRNSIFTYKGKIKKQNLSGVETALRIEIHRRAQRQHLARTVFALDEILIQPMLIAPPVYLNGDLPPVESQTPEPEIPYTPDWPEAASALSAARISLAEALSRGKNIAVIGAPGTGKTVALAQLASLVANQDPAAGSLAHCVPVYLHATTLDLSTEGLSSFEKIIAVESSLLSILVQPKLPSFLRSNAESGDMVFILDGLDELPGNQLQQAVAFLEGLRKEYPRVHIAVAASADALNGLTTLKFQPLALATWQKTTRNEFLNRWSHHWSNQVIPILARQSAIAIPEPLLVQSWLSSDSGYYTPFEYTLRVWSAFSGQSAGTSLIPNLESFIRQRLPEQAPRQMIEQLADLLIRKDTTSLPYAEIESFLSSIKIDLPPSALEAINVDEKSTNGKIFIGKKKGQKLSPGQWLLNLLLNNGLLIEFAPGWIAFTHPIFTGYISSSSLDSAPDITLSSLPLWQVDDLALRFFSIRYGKSDWLDRFMDLPDPIFFRNLQLLTRWLKDAPQQLSWRPMLYKRVFPILQNKDQPLPIRVRLIAGLASSNDPAAIPIIQQCLGSRNTSTLIVGLIGAAITQDGQFTPGITELLNSEEDSIRLLSVAALANLESPETTKFVEQIITSDDERSSVVAARCLAHRVPEGARMLRELLKSDAILTRRAAVLGISEIKENWVMPQLEKVAIEDGQWIVRSIAGQTIEELKKNNPHIPAPLVRPDQSPWLIEYAARFGEGVAKGQPVTDLLLRALKTGSIEDQLSAINYLLLDQSDPVMSSLYKIIFGPSGPINTLAHYAVWLLQASGAKAPPAAKYGLNN